VRFPVKPQKLRIMVRNTSGWHCNFHTSPKREFIEAILEYYAKTTPSVKRMALLHTSMERTSSFAYDATPNNLGMADNDVAVIRHKVNILLNMPDSSCWDMKYTTSWRDTSPGDFLQSYFDQLGLDIDDYRFVYNNHVINEWDYDTLLEQIGFASGDMIRVFKKE